jgi:hypothetical protein
MLQVGATGIEREIQALIPRKPQILQVDSVSLHSSTYLPACLHAYLPTYLPIYGSTVLLLDLGRFFSFLILYTIGRIPWTGDQPVARPLLTHRTTQTQNERKQTSML